MTCHAPGCGVTFRPKKPNQLYCSPRCSERAKAERRRAEGRCTQCGRVLVDGGCPACRERRRRRGEAPMGPEAARRLLVEGGRA